MGEEEMIEREVAFTDDWYKEHTGVPTYADAIEWAINNPPKGTSLIKWRRGEPTEIGDFLVASQSGTVTLASISSLDRWSAYIPKDKVLAWCKLSDVEPYKE